jgi:hypothetical protein
MTPLQAALSETESFTDQLMAAKVRGLLCGYDAQWADSDLVTHSVEEMLEGRVWNPATGRETRSYRVAGKLDWRGTDGQERAVIMDHKTCSEDIEDPNATYWRQLVIEGQLSHYMLLEWQNGRKVDTAVWDVVRKPDIRPRKLTRAEVQSIAMTRVWFGHNLDFDEVFAAQKTERETLEMYAARLAYDCTVERPWRYFQRRSIPRLDAEIVEYANDLWDHAQDMISAYRHGRRPRNSGACMNYGVPCAFLGICSGHDTPTSDRWRKKKQVHSELPIVDSDGRSVLTSSRIKCFQQCRRKHYYQYELGIERAEQEDSEALAFGTAWHRALEVYFNVQKEQNDSNNGSADHSTATTEQQETIAC